ncbi:MAG TPA: hypothetical protein VKZ53_13465 [Candidatus Angelobacter sp.]|nr:hypothetical protein [Candidatus Angelobacter sp.]
MARTERIRELVTGPLDLEYQQQKAAAGWQLVALEWQREIPGEETPSELAEEIPYGLQIAPDGLHLERNPEEHSILMLMMEFIVQDNPLSKVASMLTERGLQTRDGSHWTPISVFKMMPRLIEVGPKIFSSADWEFRRRSLLKAV